MLSPSLGPNGVGKTTLIKCIDKVLTPASGSVFIEGMDLHQDEQEGYC
jgi:ABC-type cobalamin/Fe3+-siderophores transport system ATPase subunit